MTTPRTEAPATTFAVALLEEFVRLGVRDVVLGPGSRSQALALAAAEFERVGRLRLRVRIDERVGGFLALGIAVETRAPVILITTSGTAVANLHPAVLEAHHSGVPLIVITADRPDSLRGIGSNQTTEQPGIFGSAVRRTWDVAPPTGQPGETDAAAVLARDAVAAATGPVHLNLAFAEPLSSPFALPDAPAPVTTSIADTLPAPTAFPEVVPSLETLEANAPEAYALHSVPGTVVVAGTLAGPRAEEVARELGAPLLAEVTSGAHYGPHLVVAYRELLHAANFGDRISRVIVFGHPTLSREVPALIQRDGVETIVVRHGSAEDYNPGHRVVRFVDAVTVVGEPEPPSWAGRWVSASRALIGDVDTAPDIEADAGAHAKSELAAVRAEVTRRTLVEAVWRATWPHDRLVLGASRLIREADKVLPGKRITVHANRGLAGIDGTISTALGIALSSTDRGTTRALVGDLTFLHDVGALLFGEGEVRPRIQVVVGNDGGGTIFDALEVAESAGPGFERVLYTPQHAPIEALAAAYGWEYRRADTRGQLDQALTASSGPTIVEVPLPRR
ncbi:2-succinyl-5-enolpyruvyl-6-hydroxy-3-cyclohexene-1-carboxylic-acid synthase [Salinibacterium soli]|uniref:2-succinyl-5-enolpyruvyl-6-hydroxy-3-cyclohexene-1-carboxylate synthase n=1 Tax=Antiquaquibacter soli TaxID=3064523 RepID=A0ABT9BIM9_9MICO|nr:2-succinyl-5-enolpyruvyl-6-hydroxy-3-cyclohexene-1-carboxylic-acid synthase [Protaetiibacter sp. WY-16]MDO7880877.1 2-succinyl-5-enolpyruvyl-6-hydroxy-3-cyclohexene-1-carboxylic-acid synthase [Protaetiibacter sp. WY-16]